MMVTGFGGMFLWWGIFLALLMGGAVLLFDLLTRARVPVENVQPTARQILGERLARGEITREEYDSVLARIEQ
jgi:uncharacterized membrane protein